MSPGEEIVVEVTWDREDWPKGDLHKVLDCVSVDGALSPERTGGEKPAANDGRFSHRYRIPADAVPGTSVCDRAVVTGPDGEGGFERQKSEIVCFTAA